MRSKAQRENRRAAVAVLGKSNQLLSLCLKNMGSARMELALLKKQPRSSDHTFPLILSFMLWFLKPFLAQCYASNPKMRTKGAKGRIQ